LRLPRFLGNIVRAGASPEIVTTRNFDELGNVLEPMAKTIEGHESAIDSILTKIAKLIPPAILGRGRIYDVRSFGTLAAALTYIGANTATLYITNEQAVTTNTTIPSNISIIVLKGGSFAISTGVTLTINGSFEAGLFHVFTGAGTVSGLYQGHPEWFGPFTTATLRTAALVLAIAACEHIIVSGAEYDPLDVVVSGKNLWMQSAVTFKVPNGFITTTPGTPALKFSADDTCVSGNFTVDGNVANQSTGGFTSAQRTGTLCFAADNTRIDGEVTINNAFWVGCQMEGGSTSGSEITDIYVKAMYIYNPGYYAFMPWTVDGWRIEELDVVIGPNSTDARVRTGTQTITGECLNGYIGRLTNTQSLVVEKRTRKLHIDRLDCGAFKCEDSADISVGSATLRGQFYDQRGTRISIQTLVIDGFDDATLPAMNINTSVALTPGDDYSGGGLYIGTAIIRDTVNATNNVQVRTILNAYIGRIMCINPAATVKGILFDGDAAYVPQENVFIGSIFSEGHATYDLEIQSGFTNIHVMNINASAVRSSTRGGPTLVGNLDWSVQDGFSFIDGSPNFAVNVTVQGGMGLAGAAPVTNYAVVSDEHLGLTAGQGYYSFGVGIPGDANYERVVMQHDGTDAIIDSQAGGTGTVTSIRFRRNGSDRLSIGNTQITAAAALLSEHATGGFGYTTGAGGTVTQGSGSGKATGVTLSKVCGQITMDGAALNAGVSVSFTLTNTAIAATDILVFNHASVGTVGDYTFSARCAAGSATITVRNVTAGNLSEAIVIGFALVKGVTA